MTQMSEKPSIYGRCKAGSLFETVHRDEFLRSAAIVRVGANEDGSFSLKEGLRYKVYADKNSSNFFNGDIKFTYTNTSGEEETRYLMLGTTQTVTDIYKKCYELIIHRYSAEANVVYFTWDADGERKETSYIVSSYDAENALTISNVNAVYVYNDDATVKGEKGEKGDKGEVNVLQETGDSTTDAMSQRATTKALNSIGINQLSCMVTENLYNKNSPDNVAGYLYDGSIMESEVLSTSEYIRVKPKTLYAFSGLVQDGHTYVRFINEFDENKQFIRSYIYEESITTAENTKFVRFTYTTGNEDNVYMVEGLKSGADIPKYEPKIPIEHIKGYEQEFGKLLSKQLFASGTYKEQGDMTTGSIFETPVMNIKKNNIYTFMCKVSQFGELKIGHGKTAYSSTYVTIDSEKLHITKYTTTADTVAHEHGLTIADYLYIQIKVSNSTADITLMSNGKKFVLNDVEWTGDSNATSFVECTSGNLTDCSFTWSSGDFRKSVFIFGDSYLGFTNGARWCYYLKENGFIDNVLLNSFAGEATSAGLLSLQNVFKFGIPQFAIWALGMNDGSDNSVSIETWQNGVDTFVQLCEENGVTPILATIPSVPTINHETKNAYIRESGYRYIDFARAVGATSDGTWFDKMLSADGVHPTESGALALYMQAITDCAEITMSI